MLLWKVPRLRDVRVCRVSYADVAFVFIVDSWLWVFSLLVGFQILVS